MSKKYADFYEAWWYLNETPVFEDPTVSDAVKDIGGFISTFTNSLCIEVQKVNPITCIIDDNEILNTKVEVWLECGEPYVDETNVIGHYHNIEYDCGGDTFEEAIIELANLVYEHNNKEEDSVFKKKNS